MLGGPGTVSDLITRIGYRSGWGGAYQLGPSPIADALSWFRNGFTSSNAAVCPGGVATGAMPCAGTTLTLSPPTLPSGTQGVSYSQALSVSGGLNCTFSAAGALPPGLALTFTGTSNTASLSGIPSAPGSYSFALDAVCLNGSAGTSATIDVTLPSQQTDFTSQVRFTLPGLVFSRFTNIFSGSVTATNIGSTTIAAPLQLVFSNLGAGVTVANQTGTVPGGSYAGAPYITAAGNSPLAPGASVTFPVRVSDPNHVPISYVPRILSGAF